MVKKVTSKVSKVSKASKSSAPQKNSKVSKVVKSKVDSKPQGKIVKASSIKDINDAAEVEKSKKISANSVSEKVSTEKITKALTQLKKFIESKSQADESGKLQLFDDELINDVQIIFTKKELFTSKKNFKPKFISITDKPASESKPKVALFVRDNLIDKALLDKIEESELNELIGEIIPGQELKSTYKQYEKRRELFNKYDLFLSDDALVTALPKLLGKVFYESKKIPIPIKISENFSIKSTINHVKKISSSVVYHVPRSNSLTINLGNVENLTESLVEQVINHFEDEELSAIFIKSNQSPSLPLYEKDVVYTEEDVASETSKDKEIKPIRSTNIEGLENVKLSRFDEGLAELADPSEIPKLFKAKIQKSLKFQKKNTLEAQKSKVTKPNKTKKVKKIANKA